MIKHILLKLYTLQLKLIIFADDCGSKCQQKDISKGTTVY